LAEIVTVALAIVIVRTALPRFIVPASVAAPVPVASPRVKLPLTV